MKKSTWVVLFAVVASWGLFANSLFVAYPKYQNTRSVDPLSLLNSLPLSFYVSMILVLVTGFYVVLVSLDNRPIHLLLLVSFGIMLWATPYLLTGFVRLPLGPWKIAQSVHIEEILRGAKIPLSWYGSDYPGSFVFNEVLLSVTSLDALVYVRWVFPLVQLFLMVLFMYLFLARIFSSMTSFLAILLTIPGLHYVVLQPAPNSLGLLLVLISLMLLTKRGLRYEMTFLFVVFTLVFTHSVYSVLLLIIISAAIVVRRIFGEFEIQASWRIFAALSIWFLVWETVAVSPFRSLLVRASGFISLSFWRSAFGGGQLYSVGGTIFSTINLIGRSIYVSYLVATLITIMLIFVFKRRLDCQQFKPVNAKSMHSTLFGLDPLLLWLFFEVLISGFTGYALLNRTPDEAERSLFLFVFTCSSLISYGVMRARSAIHSKHLPRFTIRFTFMRKLTIPLLLVFTLFLSLFYPLVAYSIDGYSNFPLSEHSGLSFLSIHTDSGTKLFILDSESQYLFYRTNFTLVSSDSLVSANSQEALEAVMSRDLSLSDSVALRSTAYFLLSIRIDHSFVDNRFIQTQQFLEDRGFNLVYSNPSFQLWVKSH